MHRYLIRRLLLTIPVLLGVATLVFSLIHLIPGDPAQAMLGEGAAPEDVAQLRERLGLDRPLLVQYGSFLQGLARGDLGVSLRNDQPVLQQILERMPATAELAFASMAVAILIALPLGIIAAVWRGTLVDHGAMTMSLVGISVRSEEHTSELQSLAYLVCRLLLEKKNKQQQVSEIMRQMLTQAQTAGQYFTNDQIKEMTRKVSAEVDLVHQQTQTQRYVSVPFIAA